MKFITTSTLEGLLELGLVQAVSADAANESAAHSIAMAGKMWLLKHK